MAFTWKEGANHPTAKDIEHTLSGLASMIEMKDKQIAELRRSAEAAERKLATATKAYEMSDEEREAQARDFGAGNVALSRPTQQLPGEDPPFGACQCSACVALRAMKAYWTAALDTTAHTGR